MKVPSKTMIVIGITGPIGSGKDTASKYLQKKYSFQSFGMGDVVRELAKERNLEPSRENLQDLGKEFRKNNGENAVAREAAKRISEKNKEKFVINGIRNPEEVEIFRKTFEDDFKLILIDAKPKIRFKRLKERDRTGSPQTLKKFKKHDKTEIAKFDMKKTFKRADFTVNNNGRLEELHKKIDRFLKDLNQ